MGSIIKTYIYAKGFLQINWYPKQTKSNRENFLDIF